MQERQIVREQRQADATVGILKRWSVQETVRRLRQANGGEGSSRQGELASVAAMMSLSPTISSWTIHSSPTFDAVLRSTRARTTRTATASSSDTGCGLDTKTTSLTMVCKQQNGSSVRPPKMGNGILVIIFFKKRVLIRKCSTLKCWRERERERERERVVSIAARRDYIIPAMPAPETLSTFQQQSAAAGRRQAVEDAVRATHCNRRWMRGLRNDVLNLLLQPLTRNVSPWSRDPIL